MTPVCKPTWESIIDYPVPQWVLDAKFGIYAHWGVYSVPAFGDEKYAKRMYDDSSPDHAHFLAHYGDLKTKGYKDLIAKFTASHFDPEQWADLIAGSGAKYAGISPVHHDGFLLWDSAVNRWNAAKMGPKRDLYGDLTSALRRRGLRITATFHHLRTFDWYLLGCSQLGSPEIHARAEKARQEGYDLFDPAYADLYWNHYTGRYEDFLTEWQAKVGEVIDKYHPDLLWFDGGAFQEGGTEKIALDVLSSYINKSTARGQEVAILNKLSMNMLFNFPREMGLLTFEQGRDRQPGIERPWIDDVNIAEHSWGYIENQRYRSATYVLHALITACSYGGGILLSLAPRHDGVLPTEQVEALEGIGSWLRINGEAIYGTRPWRITGEGNLYKIWPARLHQGWRYDQCDASDIRFTCTPRALYAIALGWPENGRLDIGSLSEGIHLGTGPIRSIRLLGSDIQLAWTRDQTGMHITLPPEPPHQHAYAFKIEQEGPLAV